MIDKLAAGAIAGIAGTTAMTVFMNPGVVGALPRRWKPDAFVPRQIVQWAESLAGRPDALTESQEKAAAAIAHLAYGSAMGAIYGAVAGRAQHAPAIARGAAWGLLVWAAGYQGWLPAAGVRPPTTHEPYSKWPVPIGNHIVFGVVTALAYDDLLDRSILRHAVRIEV
ncbi:MAG: DUF1440 domain-containing protein [Gemmatimonadota bacterium]